MQPLVTVTSPGCLPRSGDGSSSLTTLRNARSRLPAQLWIAALSAIASPEPPDCGAGGRSLSPISTRTWPMSRPSSLAASCAATV